jgi:hypothetical protein
MNSRSIPVTDLTIPIGLDVGMVGENSASFFYANGLITTK